jgi:hypothetical protein
MSSPCACRGRQLELHPWRDEMTGALAEVSGFAPPQEQGGNAVVGHSRVGVRADRRAGFTLHSRRQSVFKAGCSELFMVGCKRRPRTRELAVSTNAVRTGHTQNGGVGQGDVLGLLCDSGVYSPCLHCPSKRHAKLSMCLSSKSPLTASGSLYIGLLSETLPLLAYIIGPTMAQPPVLALSTIATSAAVPMLLHRGKPMSVQVSDWMCNLLRVTVRV